MNEIELRYLKLKTFTEQDALDYCLLNNLNPDNITYLDLIGNELTDLSGIKLFKNLKILNLDNNKITNISILKNLISVKYLFLNNNSIKDISDIKDLNKIQRLSIEYLELESDQIQYINSLKNLLYLWCKKGFKDMSLLNQLNKNINIYL